MVRVRRFLVPLALAVLALPGAPRSGDAQVLTAIAGGVGGLVAGAHVTTGLYVLKTRATGWVMHSIEHLVEPAPEAIPIVALPIAGAVVGARSGSALAGASLGGLGGLAAGGLVGAGVGHLIWKDSEGRWAGAVIGSAAGLLIGVIGGGLAGRSDTDDSGTTQSGLQLRLPLFRTGGGR